MEMNQSIGISRDDLPIPGENIEEIIEDRNITRAELAKRLGITEPYLSKVIRGIKPISNRMAQGLEYALGVDKSFWLNLQAQYEAALLTLSEADSIDEEERSIQAALEEASVGKFMRTIAKLPSNDELPDTAVLSYRRGLGVSSLRNLPEFIPTGAFRVASTRKDPCVMGAWLLLAQDAASGELETAFSLKNLPLLVEELKAELQSESDDPDEHIKHIMADYGIGFAVIPHFRGAPIQGYISKDSMQRYRMILTIRGAWADRFWFTLFHELGHIVNGDLDRIGKFIDNEGESETVVAEKAANEFARNTLIDPRAYEKFIQESSSAFSDERIARFAASQKVPLWIVKGRLKSDGHLPYSNWSGMIKCEWA